MAGHNKWSKVKHKKAITDAQKSKIYTKYTRLISNEIKKTGDINSFEVKNIIEKAKKENVPKENIERAIKKGSAKNDNAIRVIYETYGPGGCGIIIIASSSNKNKTAAEIRHILSRNGGYSLGAENSVLWLFEKNENQELIAKKELQVSLNSEDLEKLEKLISDLEDYEDLDYIYTNHF